MLVVYVAGRLLRPTDQITGDIETPAYVIRRPFVTDIAGSFFQ
jgi:hypothetical protein